MATSTGTATLTFGTAASLSIDTSIAVTGQATISGTSKCEAYFMDDATSDHSADEHILAASMMDLVCGSVVAGTGFTIFANAREKQGLVGSWTVRWVWAD
jgi:hypothetical protein